MKIHYATSINGNESDPETYYSLTACGMEFYEEWTSIKEAVTCKKCIKKLKVN
jgi:hypothetical protein